MMTDGGWDCEGYLLIVKILRLSKSKRSWDSDSVLAVF